MVTQHLTKKIEKAEGRHASQNDFREYLAGVRLEVNERIESRLSELDPKGDLSNEVVELTLHGKRLRAGLTLLVFEAFSGDGDGRDTALDLAVAIEFAHSASLIVDDMLDEDGVRRGLSSLHLSKGHKRAMLEAVGLLSFPYSIASLHGSDYVSDLCSVHRNMVYGVLKEVVKRPNLPAAVIYEEIVTRKTGNLFGLAARFGALSAGCDSSLVGRLARYGKWTGMAMQMANDITDLDQVMNGTKCAGFGTELLLLQCMVADSLFGELVAEIEARRLETIRRRLSTMWRPEGLEAELEKRLEEAIKRAVSIIEELEFLKSPKSHRRRFGRWIPTLLIAPQQIAEMILEE